MTNLRQAAEMALEALDGIHSGNMTPMAEESWNKAKEALRQALDEWTPDDTAYRPHGLSMPIDRGAWDGVEDVTQWVDELRGDDKQCSSCGGFCGEVCERENVKPNLLNQICCECGRSGGFALYCGWCWSKGDKPVADVNTSEERVPNSDKQGHECQELKASGPIGEIIEAHGLIAVSIPEMPPVGTRLYTEKQVRQILEKQNAMGNNLEK